MRIYKFCEFSASLRVEIRSMGQCVFEEGVPPRFSLKTGFYAFTQLDIELLIKVITTICSYESLYNKVGYISETIKKIEEKTHNSFHLFSSRYPSFNQNKTIGEKL